MVNTYTDLQRDILDEFFKKELCDEYTTAVIILMWTFGFSRTREDLVSILHEYPGIGNKEQLKSTIDMGIEIGYIEETMSCGIAICSVTENSIGKFLAGCSEELVHKIAVCKEAIMNDNSATLYGKISGSDSSGKVYATMLKRIREAQGEICMPMINTEPHPKTIEALLEKAAQGISIRLLFGDYNSVAKKLRANRESQVHKWKEIFANYPNVEIRVFHEKEDAILSASVIIDKNILRLCVHDYLRERASEGMLIEFYKSGCNLNVTQIVCDRFEEIWEKSHVLDENKFLRFVKNNTVLKIIAVVILLVISMSLDNLFGEITKDLAMGLIALILQDVYLGIRKYGKRFVKIARNVVDDR